MTAVEAGPTRRRIAARRIAPRGLLAFAIVVSALFAAPGAALAASPVSLTFHKIPAATIGSDVFVSATIKPSGGVAATGLRVLLYVDGAFVSSSHADVSGQLALKIPSTSTMHAGTVGLRAVFEGTHLLSPAQAIASLKLSPAQITITTVPAIEGIPISLGKASAKTGANGVATISVSDTGSQTLEAHIDQLANPAIRVSFIRWQDAVYDVSRRVNVRGDAEFVLGLRTAFRASVRFVDENGTVIDPKSISRAAFTSSTGQDLVLTNFAEPAWWEAGTAVSRTGGLQASTTLWRLSEVVMTGTNVVNQGQQAFTPTIDGTWTVDLLLYDLVIHTSDALTGSGLSGTAELVFPDNSSQVVPITTAGTAEFDNLPRGSYTVRLKTDGIAPPTPIALSRTQGATIRVISYLDIAAAVIILLVALFVLLWIGRRRHVRALMWVTAAPVRAVRALPIRGTTGAVRRRIPSARSTMSTTLSDVARVGRGPGGDALRFTREVFAALGRTVRRAGSAILGGISSAGRGRADAARRAVDAATPAWPATEPSSDIPRPARPAAASRPVTARMDVPRPATTTPSGSTWFDAPPEDEGPTHDCSRCGRAVPDSARFCRSCGHQQF